MVCGVLWKVEREALAVSKIAIAFRAHSDAISEHRAHRQDREVSDRERREGTVRSDACIALHTVSQNLTVYYTNVYYAVVHCSILPHTALYRTKLYCVLHFTASYHTLLYCTVLYCPVCQSPFQQCLTAHRTTHDALNK